MPEAEEYIIASVKIPISIKNGNSTTFQDRCQIEFYRCSNLDEFPVNNSLESSTLMQKFSQIFAGGRRPVIPVADSSEDEPEEQGEPKVLQGEHAVLQGEHAVLQGEHAVLQEEHAVLQGEHAVLQGEHAVLQEEQEEQYVPEEPEEHGEKASRNGISKTEDTSPIKISKTDPEYKPPPFSRTAIFDDLELVKKSSRYNTFRSYSTRAKSHNKFTQRLNNK
jgi:hypothetical protein